MSFPIGRALLENLPHSPHFNEAKLFFSLIFRFNYSNGQDGVRHKGLVHWLIDSGLSVVEARYFSRLLPISFEAFHLEAPPFPFLYSLGR